jgi:hypothetical protein
MNRVFDYPSAVLSAWWRAIIYLLSLAWLRGIIELIRHLIEIYRRFEGLKERRRGRDPGCPPKCGRVPADVYKRADPMIYSQRYLIEQGLAVTWNNPDIQLFENGQPVSSSQLKPNTDYEVRATIWNNSTQAPAVGLGVEFYYHDFGIGPAPIAIGNDTVTLPVKGAPGHPTTATTVWRTPDAAGHYCLKVQLHWADDANPKNNLGQENTNVGAAQSPAEFTFPVRNEDTVRRVLHLIADSYEIPPPVDCKDRPTKEHSNRQHPEFAKLPSFRPATEEKADWAFARARHGPAAHPVPAGWKVAIKPDTLDLDAGETQKVDVVVTPPEGWKGKLAININALKGDDPVGGVTLYITKDGGS